jgi:protein-S-isoprenylcysteine O-methyltransferase Ste14
MESEKFSQRTLKQVVVAALVSAAIGAFAAKYLRAGIPVFRWPAMASIAGFVTFSIYWTAAATAAAAKKAESRGSRRVHEILVNGGYLLILLPELFKSWAPLQSRFIPDLLVVSLLGLAVQGLGFLLAIWARRSLGQNWSGRIEIKVDHQLVRSGPYRLLRHPIYTAVLMMSVGMTVVIGKVVSLIGLGVIVIAYVRKIRLEEANLREAFGAEYDEYRRQTWGWVPGVY